MGCVWVCVWDLTQQYYSHVGLVTCGTGYTIYCRIPAASFISVPRPHRTFTQFWHWKYFGALPIKHCKHCKISVDSEPLELGLHTCKMFGFILGPLEASECFEQGSTGIWFILCVSIYVIHVGMVYACVCVAYACVLYKSICLLFACVYVRLGKFNHYVCIQRSELNIQCLLLLLSSWFEEWSLGEPGAPCWNLAGQSVSFQDPPVSTSPVLVLQTVVQNLAFS